MFNLPQRKKIEVSTYYRPIWFLSIISRVIDFVSNSKIRKYLEVHKVINDRQYGFRPQKYTADGRGISDRKSYSSSFHQIIVGIAQGSVLAPTLFLRHINDLHSSISKPIHTYTDRKWLILFWYWVCRESYPILILLNKRKKTSSVIPDVDVWKGRWCGRFLLCNCYKISFF